VLAMRAGTARYRNVIALAAAVAAVVSAGTLCTRVLYTPAPEPPSETIAPREPESRHPSRCGERTPPTGRLSPAQLAGGDGDLADP